MRLKDCLLFLILLASNAMAEINTSTLSGTIIDAGDGTPLEGATVYITQNKVGTTANKNGQFSISNLKSGKYTISFSYLGYKKQTKIIAVSNGEKKKISVKLQAETESLSEVYVTAKSNARKIRERAMPVAVIDMSQLAGTVSSVEDILTKTAGVTLRSAGGVGSSTRLSVRGLEGKRIGFFIDGTPMSGNSEFINVDDVPIDMIERIEIYKGVVPAKFGGSAMGGAVNIVIKEYPPKYLDASYSIESFNTHKANTVIKKNFAKSGIELGAGGFYTYSDNNYKMKSPFEQDLTMIRDHDRFENIAGAVSMKARKWYFDEIELELVGLFNNKQIQGVLQNVQHAHSKSKVFTAENKFKKKDFIFAGLDFDMTNAYVYTHYNFVDTAMHRYDWDMKEYAPVSAYGGELGNDPNDSRIHKRVFANKTNLNYIIDNRNSCNFNVMFTTMHGDPKDELQEKALGNKINYASNTNQCIVGIGYDYKTTNDKFLNSLVGKFYHYDMNTIVADSWGLVKTDVDLNKNYFGVSDALRYRITPTFLAKGSIAYEARLPTEDELIGNGSTVAASGDLKPERGTNMNIGFMYDKGRNGKLLQIELNFFYSQLKDIIRYSTANIVQGKYTNFGEMRTLGVEGEVKADFTRCIYGYANATFQDLRDTRKLKPNSNVANETKGKRMPNIPYFLSNFGLEFHKANLFGIKRTNTRIYSDASYIQEYLYDFELSKNQERRIPSSLKIDIALEHKIMNEMLSFSFKIGNITNAKLLTEYNCPLPGRTFGARIRYLFK